MESMKHTLALVLMVFGIVGCAVSTPLLVDFRDPNTKYGEAKTLYAINYLLGLIFFLVYFLFAYASTNA
jgi:hypothetical protein